MINHVEVPGLGLSFVINRVALWIGDFPIYWYGVCIAAGLLLALCFAFHYAEDFGIDSDRMVDVVVIGTVCAVICARAYYVAFAPFEYASVWEMLDIRDGGIAIYGAVIGAFVFGGLACKWRGVPMLAMFDLTSMGFLIGQCLGRWGNFFNQEAFGVNTTLPWGMYSENTQSYLAAWQDTLAAQGVTVDPSLPVHPTFLYESIWCFVAFWILFAGMKKRRFDGDILLQYIILYGAERFVVEGLRTDSLMIEGLGLRVSQVLALASALAALVLEILLRRRCRGKTLMVALARSGGNKPLPAGFEPACETALPAAAPHREFAEKTRALNGELEAFLKAQKDQEARPESEAGERAPAAPQPEGTEPARPGAGEPDAPAHPEDEPAPQPEAGEAAPRPEAPETDGQPGEENTPQNP